MKRVALFLSCFILVLIVGCSKDEPEPPTTQLDKYISNWENEDFPKMYNMVTDKTKETYEEEEYIERHEKIYGDLDITDIEVTYDELDKDVIKEAINDRNISIPLKVSMESMAGPIEFTNVMTLTLPETDKDEKGEKPPNWQINWDEGFIFPDIKDGGKISVSVEEPKRGDIVDKNQMPLALNNLAYEIGVVPQLFESEENEKSELARLLNMSIKSIDSALNESWVQPHHFVPLKTVPQTAENTLAQLTQLPAVQTRDTTGRSYPAGEAAAHLTGYVGQITAEELENAPAGQYTSNDIIGKTGLEKLYEEKLRGKTGIKIIVTKQTENNGEEEVILAEKPVKNGEHVQISIDVNIQEKIYESYENIDVSGTAAAIHPKTGEVLALISSPAYDPNELTFGITQNRWDELTNDPKKPFVNRFTSTYAPGSVLKPVTAAIGLQEGTITHDGTLEINGLKWGKDSWNDIKVTRVSKSSKPVDLRDALQRSDNIYFAQQAIAIGHKEFEDGLRNFGFEQKIPFDIPVNTSQISNSGDLKDEILLAHSSYGQGQIEMSMLHTALTFTAFFNEGNIVKPTLLEEDKNDDYWLKNVMNPEDAEKMQEYLREVVTEGTGKSALDDDLAISGKTGTVELKQSHDSKGRENGLFVGYPTDNPDILIAMMMEHTEDIGTSSLVAENVKDILIDIKK